MYLKRSLQYFLLITLFGCLSYKGLPLLSNFQITLASYYDQYAKTRAAQYDWDSWSVFNNKATALREGRSIEPEKVAKDLPGRSTAELAQARLVLMSLLKKPADTIIGNPKQTAAAQLYFDCWCQQQQENWPTNDIWYCKTNFHNSIKALLQRINSEKEFVNYANDIHSVYFKLGSDTIEQASILTMQKLISELQKVQTNMNIVLYGYTDRVGEKKYNVNLAQRRVDAVRNILVNSGAVKNDNIITKSLGEKDPLINVDTIINNPHSRRVDVFLYKK